MRFNFFFSVFHFAPPPPSLFLSMDLKLQLLLEQQFTFSIFAAVRFCARVIITIVCMSIWLLPNRIFYKCINDDEGKITNTNPMTLM